MYVILCGNPVDGIQVHGPFPSSDEAHEWAECGLKGESWWVTELHSEQNAEHYMIYLHDEDGVVMDWVGPYETIEEAERDVAKESIVNGSNSTAIYKCERIK